MGQSLGRFASVLALVVGAGTGVGLGASLVAPGVAGAVATFTVNDAGDFGLASPGTETTCTSTNVVDTANTCTLRAAIEASTNLGGDTSIELPDPTTLGALSASTYLLDDAGLGQLQIDDTSGTVTIDGAGAAKVVIEAASGPGTATTRVLKVDPGAAADISGVTIANGDSSSSGETAGGLLNCATLTLSNSVVTDNQTNAGPGGGIYTESAANTTLNSDTIIGNSGSLGGGIYGDGGTMSLTDVVVSQNTASSDGGGLYTVGTSLTITGGTIGGTGSGISETFGNTAKDGSGGGLAFFGGTVTLSGVTIGGTDSMQGNVAINGSGGGVFDSVEDPSFSGDTIEHNTADNGNGGGVFVANGTSTFTNETIEDNLAVFDDTNGGDGGGVYISSGTNTFSGGNISNNTSDDGDDGGGGGGGVYIDNGANTLTGVSITSNKAQEGSNGGGGVYVDGGTNGFTDTTVNSNQAIWTEGENGAGGGFYFDFGTNTFTGGSIDDNHAYEGGGAFLDGGTSTFNQADISGNIAEESGGGLWIDIGDTDQPTTITQSTISDNSIVFPPVGVTEFLGDGGGIFSDFCNAITLTNDTIASNTAPFLGGGYFGTGCGLEPVVRPATSHAAHTAHVVAEGTTAFLFDTVSGNTSGSAGAGGNVDTVDHSAPTIGESIVANGISGGTAGTNCAFTGGGTLTSSGYNLIDDSTCGTPAATDIIGKNPLLGSLGNNGGPTQTEVPGTGSPAIGAIPSGVCSGTGVATDQRGNARGAGLNGVCTIGAVEVAVAPSFNPNGYRMVANEGGIFDFGLDFNGSLANNHLNAPIVGIANSPGPNGYLMAGGDGGVFALGGANFFGSLGGQAIPSPIAAIAATPSEDGYWLASQSGTIYRFGNTPSLPAVQLPPGAHIVGMASTNTGKGLWLVDNFGDVYAEGDALYLGGLGGVTINAPVVGIAAAATGQGYVLVASDGGTFNYGVPFHGSVPGSLMPGQQLVAPIVGIAVTHSGNGYWEVGADGGLFNYGDAPFLGSIYTAIGNTPLNGPIVGIQHLGSAPA